MWPGNTTGQCAVARHPYTCSYFDADLDAERHFRVLANIDALNKAIANADAHANTDPDS